MRTDELEALAHRAELRASEAFDESDYETGSYFRGMHDAFAYTAAHLRNEDMPDPTARNQ